MIVFLYSVAIFIIFWGLLFLFGSQKSKKFYLKFVHSLPYWSWGIIGLILAYILWQGTTLVKVPWICAFIAILSALKGIFLLLMPKSKTENFLQKFIQKSLLFWRLLGIAVLAFGIYFFTIIG